VNRLNDREDPGVLERHREGVRDGSALKPIADERITFRTAAGNRGCSRK
jgi:hypothetical protein